MKIADFAIRHPAVIGIILISLALFGLISFRGMPNDLMANIELPEVLVVRDIGEILVDAVAAPVVDLAKSHNLPAGLVAQRRDPSNCISGVPLCVHLSKRRRFTEKGINRPRRKY